MENAKEDPKERIYLRARIKDKSIIFSIPQIFYKPFFTDRNIVIPWLKEGNMPDRCTNLKDINKKHIYENDILNNRYLVRYLPRNPWKEENINHFNVGFYLEDLELGGISCMTTENNYIITGFLEEPPEKLAVKP